MWNQCIQNLSLHWNWGHLTIIMMLHFRPGFQDSLDHCQSMLIKIVALIPMPINTYHCRPLLINSNQCFTMTPWFGIDRNWEESMSIDWHWEESMSIDWHWEVFRDFDQHLSALGIGWRSPVHLNLLDLDLSICSKASGTSIQTILPSDHIQLQITWCKIQLLFPLQ